MALAVSFLFVAFAAALSLFTLAFFERELEDSILSQQAALTSSIGKSIDNELGMVRTALVGASTRLTPAVVADKAAAVRYLNERPTLLSLFDDGTFLLRRDGTLIAEDSRHGAPLHGDTTFLREVCRKCVETTKPYISNHYRSFHRPDRPAIFVAVPLLDEHGETYAVMGGSIDLLGENLLEDLSRIRFGTNGYLYLFDRDRTIIVHPDKSRILKMAAPAGINQLFDRAAAGFEGGGRTVNSAGVAMLTTFKHLKSNDWVVAVNLPVDDAYAPLSTAKRFFALAIAGSMVAILILVWALMKKLTSPLLAMTAHVKSLPEKTGDERLIAIDAEDEIGTLALAFNEMTATLDKKQAALRSAVIRTENEKARTEAIIAAIGEGISIQDREFKVLYQNRIHKERIGNHQGKSCFQAYSRRDAVCPACPVAMAFRDGKVHTIEKTNLIGGKAMCLEITASPLRDASGEIVAGIELVRDVTEQRDVEEKICHLNADLQRRAAELAAMNRELEAFSYSLSHDLKTPLTSIYAAAQTLTDDYAPGLDETGRFMVATICKSSERMEELLNAMLLLSRVSRAELRRENVDLTSLAHEVLLRLSVENVERKVKWIIKPDVTAEGDPGLLTSVLENLLGNAWKYTRKTADAWIEFGTADRNGAKAFFVRDNGAGFDGERAAELFQPFRRLHSPEEFEGTGIGLATVQRIVVRHGGRVWAEGEAGSGATFYFTLPEAPHHGGSHIG